MDKERAMKELTLEYAREKEYYDRLMKKSREILENMKVILQEMKDLNEIR